MTALLLALVLACPCGSERWDVKVGSDAEARKVGPPPSYTSAMINLIHDGPYANGGPRSAGEEAQWTLEVALVRAKIEADSDYHLILSDGAGHTMIAEIPAPRCVPKSSPFRAGIVASRTWVDARWKLSASHWTKINRRVTVTGVGFFDVLHGQAGAAPNGFELHPVLWITTP